MSKSGLGKSLSFEARATQRFSAACESVLSILSWGGRGQDRPVGLIIPIINL